MTSVARRIRKTCKLLLHMDLQQKKNERHAGCCKGWGLVVVLPLQADVEHFHADQTELGLSTERYPNKTFPITGGW